MTVKEVLPAPRDWVVFHYHTASDGKVTDWFWQPLSYVAHCLDADGQSAILPFINGWLPTNETEFVMSHPAAAREWLYDETNIVEREALERYLEAVQA